MSQQTASSQISFYNAEEFLEAKNLSVDVGEDLSMNENFPDLSVDENLPVDEDLPVDENLSDASDELDDEKFNSFSESDVEDSTNNNWQKQIDKIIPFQNPPDGSVWKSNYTAITSLGYADVIKQINKFTGPQGFAVGLKNSKQPHDNKDKPFIRAYLKCDHGGKYRCPKSFNVFERKQKTDTWRLQCDYSAVLH